MITIIGEYLADIKKDRETFLGGIGLNTAIAVAKLGSTSAFFSPISEDEYGDKLMNLLVDEQIIFDPELCGNKLPSPKLKHKEKKDIFEYQDSSSFSLTRKALLKTLSFNGDVKIMVLGGLSIFTEPFSKAVYDILRKRNPLNPVYLELDFKGVDLSKIDDFEKKFKRILPFVSILRLTDVELNELSKLNSKKYSFESLLNDYPDLNILFSSEENIKYISNDGFVIEKDLGLIKSSLGVKEVFTGALLVALEDLDVFGDYGENPKFIVSKELIDKAIDFALKAQNTLSDKNSIYFPTKEDLI